MISLLVNLNSSAKNHFNQSTDKRVCINNTLANFDLRVDVPRCIVQYEYEYNLRWYLRAYLYKYKEESIFNLWLVFITQLLLQSMFKSNHNEWSDNQILVENT